MFSTYEGEQPKNNSYAFVSLVTLVFWGVLKDAYTTSSHVYTIEDLTMIYLPTWCQFSLKGEAWWDETTKTFTTFSCYTIMFSWFILYNADTGPAE